MDELINELKRIGILESICLGCGKNCDGRCPAGSALRINEKYLTHTVPYQLCPKCNGQGVVSKPPYVAGDVLQWTSGGSAFTCDVCTGNKIISMLVVRP